MGRDGWGKAKKKPEGRRRTTWLCTLDVFNGTRKNFRGGGGRKEACE